MVKEHYFLVRHSGLLREGKVAYFHFWPLELSITVQNFIQLACSQSLSHNKYMFFAGWEICLTENCAEVKTKGTFFPD